MSMEPLWGLLQGAVRLSGVGKHLRPPPLSALQPPPKPQSLPLPFPPQYFPSNLPLRTPFLALCSFDTPKSLTLLLPGPPCPSQTSFPNLMPAMLPTEKVVPTTLSDHLQACGRHPAGLPRGGRGRRGGGCWATGPLLCHGAEGP